MSGPRILVPTDFSACAGLALRVGDDWATRLGGALDVLHVHPLVETAAVEFHSPQPPEQLSVLCAALERQLAAWASGLSTPETQVRREVVVGSPISEIVGRSAHYDLVVLGTHGRTGVSRFLLGSVTERVVRGAMCSVYVAKQKGAS